MPRDTYPPIAEVASFKMLGTASDGVEEQAIQNTIYVRKSGGWGGGVAAFAEDIIDAWKAEICPELSVEYTFERVIAKDLSNTANIPVEIDTAPENGGEAGEAAPYSACAVARLPGTLPQRPKYGYLRLGPLPEAKVRGNHLTVAYQGEVQTAVREFLFAVNGIDASTDVVVVAVLVSQDDDPVPPDVFMDAGEYNPVGLATVRRKVGRSVSRAN